MNAPVRLSRETDEERRQRFIDEANYAAACIAAREVRAHYLRTRDPECLASLEAWSRGERSWPWPDSMIEADTAADAAVMGLVRELGE
jgi:hypothetical protein